MRKKSIILFILLLCMAFGVVCYVMWMRGIEEAIHFIKEDSPREILWGESLAEKDFVELDSSARDATVLFHYDDSIINKEQLLTVTVSCNGYKTSRAFNLTIVDRDPPIIKYTGPVKIESDPNVRLSDYLKVMMFDPMIRWCLICRKKMGIKHTAIMNIPVMKITRPVVLMRMLLAFILFIYLRMTGMGIRHIKQ